MSLINYAKVMVAKLQQKMHIKMILESLHNGFHTSIESMHELESDEQSIVKLGNIYHIECSFKPKGQLKCGKMNKKNKGAYPITKLPAMKKLKGKCFKCIIYCGTRIRIFLNQIWVIYMLYELF